MSVVGDMYGARPSGKGVVTKSPPPHRCDVFLAARWHFLQTHSPSIMSTCLSQTDSLQRMHWATGADARAARPRFGPPHCGHSPAARLTYS
jgi:hypothetical protein